MGRPTSAYRASWIALCLLLTLGAALPSAAAAAPAEASPEPTPEPDAAERVLRVPRAHAAPEVDGHLDEPAWEEALAIPLPWEFEPRDNAPAPVETTCLLTYDGEALYIAFRARDPEPETIRARFSDRDGAFDDDWVGIFLDTFRDQRRGFELLVNPLGVQMDLVRNEVGGGREEDPSWDAIWHSAGRLTGDGYVVEMAIPFTSLRFQGGDGPQTWGFLAVRSRPRSVGRKFASVAIDLDVDCLLCQAQEIQGFAEAEPGRNLELDPTVTAGLSQEREGFPGGAFSDDGLDFEPGVTGIWGITPNLTLSGTLNPDFSQVEADVAQLGVNRQFTLFFPEKRPFFLEGADYFSTPIDAVFTRNVAAPDWGLKLTGKQGSHAVGVFVADDSVTNLLVPGSQSSSTTALGSESRNAVVRYRRDVGASSTLGVLATSREGTGYSNRVYGIDGLVRLSDADSVSFQALGSRTEYPGPVAEELGQPGGPFDGSAFEASYSHNTRQWGWGASWESRAEEFRADLGFVPRVDFEEIGTRVRRSWWGEDEDWWTRFQVDVDFERAEDQQGTLLDQELEVGVEMRGPWQSFARLEWGGRDQTFAGLEFKDQREWAGVFSLRPNASIRMFLFTKVGDAVDFANVRPADRILAESEIGLNLGRHFELEVRNSFERLDVEAGRLFTANLTQATAVYQLSVRTFVRLISQYTDIDRVPGNYTFDVEETTEQLFNQLLFSYKINPQTVAFFGYSDTHLGAARHGLIQRDRTLFMKVGYALLF